MKKWTPTSTSNFNKKDLPFQKQYKAKSYERTTEDLGLSNPFNIPNHKKLFVKSKKLTRKNYVPFIMSEPRTICDIDNTFFKIIEGRPLRQFNDIKVYMRNIRDITLFRANAAYLKDEIIQIDTSFVIELQEYNTIEEFFNSCMDSFAKFAKDSYDKAKTVQNESIELEKRLNKVEEELVSLSFDYVALRNRLGVIMVNFEVLSKYRQFLNMLAPSTWLAENDQVSHLSIIFDSNSAEFNTPRTSIDEFKSSVNKLENNKAILYFKKPRQLMLVFENISQQCLTYMGINVLTSNIISSVLKGRDYLKIQMAKEINEMQDLVEAYGSYVKFIEEKEQDLILKFTKILLNDFQALFSSYGASKLFTCVQFTNTQVFHGPEDPKDNLVTMMKYLERHYIELTSALDNLNQEVVKDATDEFFSQDLKMMKMAHLAQRSLRECDILSKALNTSFEPPRRNFKKRCEV